MKYLPFLLPFLFLCACQQDAPVTATPDLPAAAVDTLSFEVFTFRDSAVLVPDFPGSPQARYAVQTFIPKSGNQALDYLIQTALGRDIAGEYAPVRVTDLPQTLRIASREILANYRKQTVDTSDLVGNFATYSLSFDHTTTLRCNTAGLLTLATTHYAYTGGAHGNYYTTLQTFVTDSVRLLTYEDVFLPDQEAVLSQLLTEKAEHLGISYDTETVPTTKNFAFTQAGLLFNYPPYEIASYAAGEIEIILPYAEVSHLMTGLAEGLVLQSGLGPRG